MSSTDDKVRDLIAEEAAEWFVANREGLAAKERQAFVAWLQTSPVHVEEYLAHSVIARDLGRACEYSDDALGELLARARTQPDLIAPSSWARLTTGLTRTRAPGWRPGAVTAATCVVVGIGWFGLEKLRPIRPVAAPEAIAEINMSTHHGEQLTRRLADNSLLHLNTDSAVTIRYSNKERVVILHAGEADFEVVHDDGREFRVVAGAAHVIDRGTKFDVLLGLDMTVVTVVEGKVAVGRQSMSGGGEEVPVGGNQQVTVVDGIWPPAQPIAVDAQHATAWLHRQIVFDHAPLDKVADEFNRYALKPIEIVTPGLQKLEISGIFTIDDPAAFIAFLRSLDTVRVEETATQIRVSGNPK
jgi:transmembrane sensor